MVLLKLKLKKLKSKGKKMFAPPNVANAKTAQAIQATQSNLSTSPRQEGSPSLQARLSKSNGGAGESLVNDGEKRKTELTASASAPTLKSNVIVDCELPSLNAEASPNDPETQSLYTPAADNSSKDSNSSLPGIDKAKTEFDSNEFTAISSQASTVSLQPSSKVGKPSSSPTAISSATDPYRKRSKKNRKSAWFNLISPPYKSKCDDFKRNFKDVPDGEMLVVDYSCALQRDILVHGRLYVTQNYLCFYANIFKWETTVVLKCKDITSMTKEKTALVIPNAIQCSTEAGEKFFFTSFAARDKTYLMLFRIWQNALLSQPMSITECWKWIHYSYGDELGLSTDDEDFFPSDDLRKFNPEISVEEGELAQPDSTRCSPNGVKKTQALLLDDSTSSSDEVDDDGGGASCNHEHPANDLFLDKTYNMSVDHAFTCLFTTSEFSEDFLQNIRRAYNVKTKNWVKMSGEYKQQRELDYYLPLNIQFAKCCTVKEIQRLHKNSKAGQRYSITTEANNGGVPYADSYYMSSHFCLTSEGPDRFHLKVYTTLFYRKAPWGFIKSLMEKTAIQGSKEFAADLDKAFSLEEKRYTNSPESPLSDAGVSVVAPVAANNTLNDAVARNSSSSSKSFIMIVLCVFIMILLLSNLFFVWKLYSSNEENSIVPIDIAPKTVEQWNLLFTKREKLHKRQLYTVQKLIERTLIGLDNMRESYKSILDVIAQNSAASAADKDEL